MHRNRPEAGRRALMTSVPRPRPPKTPSGWCGRPRGGRREIRLDRSRSSEWRVRRAVGVSRPSTSREITGFARYAPKRPETGRRALMTSADAASSGGCRRFRGGLRPPDFAEGHPEACLVRRAPRTGRPFSWRETIVQSGGGAQSCLHNWAAMLQKNVLVKAPPCSSRHLCAARAESAAGAGSANFGFLRWLRRRVISAVCAQCGPRMEPPHAHVEVRSATLWRDSLGSGGVFVGGSSGAVSRRSRAPPFGMRWACGLAAWPWVAQHVEMYLL